ncbi:MAG: ABC transporter permease [Anaerolineae bacterium]|nr:ABC transporter permease [Gloeobacterales cyanobacterium ES-bin-313]
MIRRFTTQSDYLLREALIGLWRGGWMNWAAISTLTALLFLLGLGLQVSTQLDGALAKLGSQLEISVYLQPKVRAIALEPKLRSLPDVLQVQSIPKEVAWEALQKELGVQGDISESLGGNPLVDTLRVQVARPTVVAHLAQQIQSLQGVESVNYGSEAAERLGSLQKALGWAALTLASILGISTVAVITTTIRLIVLSRRKEIEVLQLVGATPLRIAIPFVLEGFALGLLGTGFAWGLLLVTGSFVEQKRQEFLPFLAPEPIHLPLGLILLGTGTGLGVIGSLLAVRSALREN